MNKRHHVFWEEHEWYGEGEDEFFTYYNRMEYSEKYKSIEIANYNGSVPCKEDIPIHIVWLEGLAKEEDEITSEEAAMLLKENNITYQID